MRTLYRHGLADYVLCPPIYLMWLVTEALKYQGGRKWGPRYFIPVARFAFWLRGDAD